jgi:histidyl-tRNA synthetase
MDIKAIPGVFDIMPNSPKEDWRSSHLWNYVEKIIRETANEYGYREIRTPILERAELFKRVVGETTDIVSKEMYTFLDRGERLLALRPEGTAPVARAYIEHNLQHESPIQKLFYIGAMFRYERQQAGRYRQHHQFGVEAIGSDAPEQDAEIIDLLHTLYSRLGMKDLTVRINSLGSKESRTAYREALINYLLPFSNELSEDSKNRVSANPLRVLDSKDPRDKEIVSGAPKILDFLSEGDQEHFSKVLKCLDSLKIPYVIDPMIVRGLDYYNRTIFEVVSGELGSQNSVGGGGRYDGLIQLLGGPQVPSSGFGTGIERIIQVMQKQNVALPASPSPILYLIPMGEEAKNVCFKLTHQLREEHLPVEMDFTGRKLNKSMQYANQIKARFVAVVGEDELASQQVDLKDMLTGEKSPVPLFKMARILKIEHHGDQFINAWKEMSVPFDNAVETKYFAKKLSQTIQDTKQITEDLENAIKKMKEIL